jgi:hypothetical protein
MNHPSHHHVHATRHRPRRCAREACHRIVTKPEVKLCPVCLEELAYLTYESRWSIGRVIGRTASLV